MSRQSYEQLSVLFKNEAYKSGDLIIKKGMPNGKEYLVISGLCRTFVLDPSGQEISLSFFLQGQAISPNITRTDDTLSTINLQALINTELISFSKEGLIQLMIQNREILEWGNQVIQKELIKKTKKELAQASLTAKDRLLRFREDYGMLENLIPHAYIASYLGITTISLSRLRGSLSHKS